MVIPAGRADPGICRAPVPVDAPQRLLFPLRAAVSLCPCGSTQVPCATAQVAPLGGPGTGGATAASPRVDPGADGLEQDTAEFTGACSKVESKLLHLNIAGLAKARPGAAARGLRRRRRWWVEGRESGSPWSHQGGFSTRLCWLPWARGNGALGRFGICRFPAQQGKNKPLMAKDAGGQGGRVSLLCSKHAMEGESSLSPAACRAPARC